MGKTEGKEAKGDGVAGIGGNPTTMSDLYTDGWKIEQAWAAGWEREEGRTGEKMQKGIGRVPGRNEKGLSQDQQGTENW